MKKFENGDVVAFFRGYNDPRVYSLEGLYSPKATSHHSCGNREVIKFSINQNQAERLNEVIETHGVDGLWGIRRRGAGFEIVYF